MLTKKALWIVVGGFVAVLGLWLGQALTIKSQRTFLFQKTYLEVCNLIHQNYFEVSPKLESWYDQCMLKAKMFPSEGTVEALIEEIQGDLAQFEISHLSIWDPLTTRLYWMSSSKDTGMRVRRIADHFIIHELVEGGPAQVAGLQVGDEVKSLNGKRVNSEWDVRTQAGRYSMFRKGKPPFSMLIQPEELRIDESPRLIDVGDGNAVLKIPSFVPNYFEDKTWKGLAAELSDFRRIVIDVRGNSGGNFVAMLKVLSPFVCAPTEIGKLIRPRAQNKTMAALEEDLTPEYQLGLISEMAEVHLKTYSGYPCYNGRVMVLIDGGSASVTEVFAQAFYQIPSARIWGDFSGGQVVQAKWFPLPLGEGYSISIPDALYVSAEGERLEGKGVRPMLILQYDLEEARQGIDSWIERALE